MREFQELHCHACNRYVQFQIDTSLNGNHVIKCPNCDHEHCRVVKDGIITDGRWDQRNGNWYGSTPYYVSGATSTAASSHSSNTYYTYQSWSSTSNSTSSYYY